jgi:mono/diheme cytochrome c family protein
MSIRFVLFGALALILTACSESNLTHANATSGKAQQAARWYSQQQVSAGAEVFKNNCAECHGINGQGAFNWTKIGPDGKYPPPPLNGTGHAWHHPLSMLFHVVKNGSPGGQGNMPPWKEKLSDEEMIAAIAWFQSQWPDDVYAAWLRTESRARADG